MRKNKRRKGRKPSNSRDRREKFLIVCEGEKTEPNYFESFRVPKKIKVVGLGANTKSLVERAIDLKKKDDYDQTWCVFDKDSFRAEQFNGAIQLANQHDIQVAYSNEAFEIWYILHYCYIDSGVSRTEYSRMLEKHIGRKYKKNSVDMYDLLIDLQADAIRNCDRLLSIYNPHRPAKDNPCTTVHKLVIELMKNSV